MADTPEAKLDYSKVGKNTQPQMVALEELFKAAEEFVRVHYVTKDLQDRNIKVLATVNQLVEIKKLQLSPNIIQNLRETPKEQKG